MSTTKACRIFRQLFCALVVLAAIPRVQAETGKPERPNILWITCEDISPNLGCYGDTQAITPNLDRLAARGVRYTQAFATTGVCATARSSLITSMYASSIGSQHMRCKTTLPDTPLIRKDWARYLDLTTMMDKVEIPSRLGELARADVADNIIVFFFSDHGAGLPRAKQFIYDSGMQVPLLIYFPPKWRHLAPDKPGSTVDRLVSFVDSPAK